MNGQQRSRDGRFAQTVHGESDVDLPGEPECSECGEVCSAGADLCDGCTDDLLCWECGERNDNGEGSDGLCGNCADRHSCPECCAYSEDGFLCEDCFEEAREDSE